ncbi:MAG: glycosyltransferase family 4 protein [Desulfobacterales bacterium]|jgi:glycosyltransferase involved in cell wall biosynthesis
MKILFYAPFKPLGHSHPSGDLVTATEIVGYLVRQGHEVIEASALRCRWIYWKPWLWPKLILERRRILRRFKADGIDIWFTYHTYYKAPDLLGPFAAKKLEIPYVIFQGIYSTKRRRDWRTCTGFYLNRRSLCAAQHIFSNKKLDLLNLKRLLPENKMSYIAPGLVPDDFNFDPGARAEIRKTMNLGDDPVAFSAAMFRRDVKTEGLTWVIRTCGQLYRQGNPLWLVIAGDGKEKDKLKQLADAHLPQRVRFVGRIARSEMYRYYSASDLFIFPGIRESLGMVFLEAQACGLPAVAFDNAGVPEAVKDGVTGLLVPPFDGIAFEEAIARLLNDAQLRRRMGRAAYSYVRQNHDLNQNYLQIDRILQAVVQTANNED